MFKRKENFNSPPTKSSLKVNLLKFNFPNFNLTWISEIKNFPKSKIVQVPIYTFFEVSNFQSCWVRSKNSRATTGDWLRTVTSDQTIYTIIRRSHFELVGMTSPDRNYWQVIITSFVSPGLYFTTGYYYTDLYLNKLKTEDRKYCNFKKNILSSGHGASFQRQEVRFPNSRTSNVQKSIPKIFSVQPVQLPSPEPTSPAREFGHR